jgi:hypothetical protein
MLALGGAAKSLLACRKRALDTLDEVMDSKTSVPIPPERVPEEEKEQPSRECDEAYLLMRSLLKGDESELADDLARRRFLMEEPATRDAEIANYRKTGKWMRLVDYDPEEIGD